MQATKVGDETALSQIIRLVDDATSSKAPIAKMADKVAGVFVPIVIGIALVAAIVWMICGATFGICFDNCRFRPGCILSLCAWFGNTYCDHGRYRTRRNQWDFD